MRERRDRCSKKAKLGARRFWKVLTAFSFLVISFPKGVRLPQNHEVAQDLLYRFLFLLTKILGNSTADQLHCCAGQLALHKQKQSLFVAFVNFHDINTPTKANFEPPEFHQLESPARPARGGAGTGMHLLSRGPVSSQCAALLSCDAFPSPPLPALAWLLSQCPSPTLSRKPSRAPSTPP